MQIIRRVLGPGGREVEHEEPDTGAHTDLLTGLRDYVGEIIHIIEARRPAVDHFRDREQCPGTGKLAVDPALLRRPDMVL